MSTLRAQILFSHGSGGQESKIRVMPGWFFLETVRENPSPASLLVSGGCQHPWHLWLVN